MAGTIDWSQGEQVKSAPAPDATYWAGTPNAAPQAPPPADPQATDADNQYPTGQTYWSPEQFGNWPYTGYQVVTRISDKTGLRLQAVAGPPGTPGDVVRLHAPVSMLTVTWIAERLGAQPVMPHWDLGNPNCVLRAREIIPENPCLQADGQTWFYRVRGTYVYDLQIAMTDLDGIFVGATPAVIRPAAANTIGVQQFDKTLLSGILFVNQGQVSQVTF